MRILKISDVYFPRVNGVSTSIRTFGQELVRQGHHVTLIAPQYKTQHQEEDDFNIIRIASRYVFVDPEDRYMQPAAIKKHIGSLKQQQFDLVHIHTPFVAHYLGVRLGKELGIPVVETYHTYFEEYLDKYVPWMSRKVLRYTARHFSRGQCSQVDRVIVPTNPMLEVLRSYGIKNQAAVIPTGIPAGTFIDGDASAFRQQFGIAPDRPVITYVGRVAHEKNIDFLIRVTDQVRQQIPDILFIIVGGGPAMKALQKQVAKNQLEQQVKFVGYLSREQELPDCYAATNVFTFASSTETQGLVLLEAMQAGTPVVTTAVMGTAEIMCDERGGLVAEENISAFSAAVIKMLEDPELQQKSRAEGIQKAAEWEVPATTQRLAAVYAELIKERGMVPGKDLNYLVNSLINK